MAQRPNLQHADSFAKFVREALSGTSSWLPKTTHSQLQKSLDCIESLGSVSLPDVAKTLSEPRDSPATQKRKPKGTKVPSPTEEDRAEFERKRSAVERSVREGISLLHATRKASALDSALKQLKDFQDVAWPNPVLTLAAKYVYVRNMAAINAAVSGQGMSKVTAGQFNLHAALTSFGSEASKLTAPLLKTLLLLLGEVQARTAGNKKVLVERLYSNCTSYLDQEGKYSEHRLGA